MKNTDVEHLLDNCISNENLDIQVGNTNCLRLLSLLLNLKHTRIVSKKCEKIIFPVSQIYEQEHEDIDLQCEVVRVALLVIENDNEEILNIITYLNYHTKDFLIQSTKNLIKIAKLFNQLMLFCKAENKRLFQQNVIPSYINKFLLHILFQKNHPLRKYILSCTLENYVSLLTEPNQVYFFDEIFSHCQVCKNLDVLCTVFNYADVDTNVLLTETQSILYKETFWKFIRHSLLCTDNILQKQAAFILEKWVRNYYNEGAILHVNIPFLEINNKLDLSLKNESTLSTKIWQHFFILLDTSKEMQTHLVRPSLKLLDSVKFLNPLWQQCIYKILLSNKQNSIAYFVVSHILQENIHISDLNKYILFAINKNNDLGQSTKIYPKLPLFCNKLDQFSNFLEDILEITWTPTTMWCLFNNLFCSKLEQTIPFKFYEVFYKFVERLPHIYIRNGCMNIFMVYFINNYDWKHDFDNICKILFILKKFNEGLFTKVVLKNIDADFLNNIISKIKCIDHNYTIDLKTFQLFIQILKVLEHQAGLQIIFRNTKNFNRELLTVVYDNLFDYYDINDMEIYVENEVGKLEDNCIAKFLDITCNLMAIDDIFNERVYSNMIDILNEPNNRSRNLIYTAFYIIVKRFKPHDEIQIIVNKWKRRFLVANKTDEDLLIYFIELYFLTNKNLDILFLEYIFNTQSDVVITKTLEKFSLIVSYKECPHEISSFLKTSLNLVTNLTKSRYFKSIVFNYINSVFSVSFFTALSELKMLDIIPTIINSLLVLSVTFPIISYYLSKKIKDFVLCHGDNKYFNILVPVIVELLLQGVVSKKEERVEYMVCQEICEKIGNTEDNPNMKKTSSRLCALESMLIIINTSRQLADNFALCLMEKYKVYYNKRYFPDSQIHLQKLRIIQALLTIHPFINSERKSLIDLIMDSFCTEIHQPCVKQLMQWLLFYLLKDDEETSLFIITAKIDSSTKTHPSTIVAFIMVLLHLTLSRSVNVWYRTVEALLPWCMGAHFKLRVYSQAALHKLFKEARYKSHHSFIDKYGFLEKSVDSVIEASGQAFYETLKSDKLLFDVFNPETDYSLHSIYIDIPRLNGVTKTEWENITHYEFTNASGIIEISNKNKTFANSIIDVNVQESSENTLFNSITAGTYNIQRKITPWKTVMEEQEKDKQLGDFILIASLIDKTTNLGGLSRTCEVFGVKQLILNDAKIINDKEFKSLSMTSENWVNAIEVKPADLKQFILKIREQGYSVIGAEQTSESINLNKYKFKKRTALIMGHEREGIPPDLIPILDACIEIPQFGMVRSLNVHVAGAMFIWEYAKQHLV